jgi:hypothetical protein
VAVENDWSVGDADADLEALRQVRAGRGAPALLGAAARRPLTSARAARAPFTPQARIATLKGAAASRRGGREAGHGDVREITEEDFLKEVTSTKCVAARRPPWQPARLRRQSRQPPRPRLLPSPALPQPRRRALFPPRV